MEAKQERSAAPARVAIYARVSSEPQVERGTIQSQIDDLLARAAADGHSVGAELRFIDNGYSGASLVRPALERLRDLAAMAVVDRLYVHAPDRLARNYAYQAVLVEEFAHTGTEVVFLNRPIGQSAEDNLLLQLQGMFADYAGLGIMRSAAVATELWPMIGQRSTLHYSDPRWRSPA